MINSDGRPGDEDYNLDEEDMRVEDVAKRENFGNKLKGTKFQQEKIDRATPKSPDCNPHFQFS